MAIFLIFAALSNLAIKKHYISTLTLPLPRGGGQRSSQPPKGFPSINFEQNNLETCNFDIIHIGGYDQI